MSLINEALKKAQKQRTGEAPTLSALPSVGGESARQIARRAQPAGFNSLLLRAGLGLGVFVVLMAGGWWAVRTLRHRPAEVPVAIRPAPVAPPATPAPAPVTPVQTARVPASAPAPFVVPVVTTPVPVVPQPAAAPPPAPPVIVSPPPAPVAKAPRPAGPPSKLEPNAIAYIEDIRIAGIRASATDSKVLMNDRVYRIGDTVEYEMGLRLTAITSSSLTFEDEHGGRYTRQF